MEAEIHNFSGSSMQSIRSESESTANMPFRVGPLNSELYNRAMSVDVLRIST